ncbi:hypothetical protein B1J92_H01611g [Nakaseomyces glabratus]|uniref:Uncharacterized protein n=1 Tax=Candida glabrata (strain ATCC 2001 / BCRC 20586 / JCM 3761 / NBRC 0622 / NRRL Y-65 / CBS 138) TaxID=284593 RepID=B4UN06_CANGA|nr:uncharacterized protein CAGL0H01611g [Nakaseomyces glabratus]OXB42729.1 hypothetical protein B1J91_H01611g [Nakaseomyces glabratus]OXB48028.1 hypothetical protein B1J92_H01611g [Nakaseomyces glabratus]CAR57986.1 unnamed protein product [Nakaseomyces glabratus]|eukprot:XP_002999549.1 uncharacterized protein CAGL0H01611g [[Candida] glabrata]
MNNTRLMSMSFEQNPRLRPTATGGRNTATNTRNQSLACICTVLLCYIGSQSFAVL